MKMKIFSVPVEILNTKSSYSYSIVLSRTLYTRDLAISALKSDVMLLKSSLGEDFSVNANFSLLTESESL
jgi:hypothetical protein